MSPTESTAWGMRTIGNTLEQTERKRLVVLHLQQLQVEQYAGTRYVREMNSKTSSKAGGTADIKIIRPGIRLCIPGFFALRKILSERKILKE